MNEGFNEGTTFEHFPRLPQDPEEYQGYFEEALDRIRSGQPVFVQRNFYDESGRIIDFYKHTNPIGYIEEESGSLGCEVYVYKNPNENLDAFLVGKDLSLAEAVKLLESGSVESPRRLKGVFRSMMGH